MGRKEDLEQHIRESYNLIREYEEILRLSSDPREKARARQAIEEQRELIRVWSEEYRQIGGTLPDYIVGLVNLPSELQTDITATDGLHSKRQEPVSRVGYFFTGLLGLDLILVLVLGWRFFGNQPELLSYLEVVTGILGLGLEVLLLGIVIRRKMSITDILRWLESSAPWQGGIAVVTIALLVVVLWPQRSQATDSRSIRPPIAPQGTEAGTPPVVTTNVSVTPTATRWAGPCRIESFEAEPPSPQPVGSLVIFKIRGTCESGVRAIRLLVNDEWYDEKGGHIPPAEEFVPTWSTKDLKPGDYRLTAEVATWKDDDWQFAASQTLTYTLLPPSNPTGSP